MATEPVLSAENIFLISFSSENMELPLENLSDCELRAIIRF